MQQSGRAEKLIRDSSVRSKKERIKLPLAFHREPWYPITEQKNRKVLRGWVKFPTGGIVRDPYVLKMAENKPEGSTAADLVRFQNRQYSLDERRKEQSGLSKEPDVLYEQKSK